MTGSRSRLVHAAWWLVSATVVVGWFTSLDQFVEEPATGRGTMTLVAFSVGASLGLALAAVARRRDSPGLMALGLLMVAASPTVFAYVLNIVVLCLALAEVVVAVVRCRGAEPGCR
jgi:hypothetical protein